MDVLFRVTLRRPNASTPWGFRLNGNKDFNKPLIFREIYPNSIADNCGLVEGDQVVVLAGKSTQNMREEDVHGLIVNAGNVLEVIVERRQLDSMNTPQFSNDIHPKFTERSENIFSSFPMTGTTFSDINFKVRPLPGGTIRNIWSSPSSHPTADSDDRFLYNIANDVKRAIETTHPRKTIFPHRAYYDDDIIDRVRKVSFAEPVESSIVELQSSSSRAASVDPDFLGHARFSNSRFPSFKQFQSFHSSLPENEYSSNFVMKRFGNIGALDSQNITFPTLTKNPRGTPERLVNRVPTEYPTINLYGNLSEFSPKLKPSLQQVHYGGDEISLMPKISEKKSHSSTTPTAKLPVGGIPSLPAPFGTKKSTDPTNLGLFAVLDSSFAEKLMNWSGEPSNVQQSATLKLVRELDNEQNDSYY